MLAWDQSRGHLTLYYKSQFLDTCMRSTPEEYEVWVWGTPNMITSPGRSVLFNRNSSCQRFLVLCFTFELQMWSCTARPQAFKYQFPCETSFEGQLHLKKQLAIASWTDFCNRALKPSGDAPPQSQAEQSKNHALCGTAEPKAVLHHFLGGERGRPAFVFDPKILEAM